MRAIPLLVLLSLKGVILVGPVVKTDTTTIVGISDVLEGLDFLLLAGIIMETQSSVAQTQYTTLATEMTTAAAEIYPVEQIARPTEEVGTSATITSAITSTTHTSVQGVSNAECQTGEPAVVIGEPFFDIYLETIRTKIPK